VRLPTWDEISKQEDQLDVLEYPPDRSLFVVGPPGSGKTILALRRGQMIADTRHVKIITFNRMLRRLLGLLGGENMDIQTMHQFVWQNYKDLVSEEPPQHSEYDYDWEAMIDRVEDNQAHHDGLHLIVDEGQDLPRGFFKYASYTSDLMTVFADEDQALKMHHSTLEDIKTAANLDDPLILKNNHRNSPEIAMLAEHFHSGRLPVPNIHRDLTGEPPRLIRKENLESTATFISNWYTSRGDSIGVIVKRNNTGDQLYTLLCNKLSDKRVDIYRNDQKNEDNIDMLSSGVTILNKESVKGQEFNTVFILELEAFIPCKTPADRRSMYMMCARACNHLFLIYASASFLTRARNSDLPGPRILERP